MAEVHLWAVRVVERFCSERVSWRAAAERALLQWMEEVQGLGPEAEDEQRLFEALAVGLEVEVHERWV